MVPVPLAPMTTGSLRAEMCALRRTDLDLQRKTISTTRNTGVRGHGSPRSLLDFLGRLTPMSRRIAAAESRTRTRNAQATGVTHPGRFEPLAIMSTSVVSRSVERVE